MNEQGDGRMIWILGILLIIISIQFARYRRQIKDICRQMSFLEEEQSNKLVTIQYATKEFEDLAGHINVLNERCGNTGRRTSA